MKTLTTIPLLTTLLASALFAGCGGTNEVRTASSGDPEADRRADARVGSVEGDSDSSDSKDTRTLYQRLGGFPGIAAIVDDMTERTIADPRVNFERSNVKKNFLGAKYEPWQPTDANVARFKQHMTEFLCLAAGGPTQYSGREIGAVHKGMKITNNEFDAMVGDIKASMDKLGVKQREKRDLLAIVETTRKQIVEVK
jgi:hemoglobin